MEVEVVQRIFPQESKRDWLVGGGEMGELIRSIDWSEALRARAHEGSDASGREP